MVFILLLAAFSVFSGLSGDDGQWFKGSDGSEPDLQPCGDGRHYVVAEPCCLGACCNQLAEQRPRTLHAQF